MTDGRVALDRPLGKKAMCMNDEKQITEKTWDDDQAVGDLGDVLSEC